MAPSITPLAIDSGTAGSGICTGVAPSDCQHARVQPGGRADLQALEVVQRLHALGDDKWNDEPSLVCSHSGLTPLYSSSACFCTKVQ
jgi:hypothetical protein